MSITKMYWEDALNNSENYSIWNEYEYTSNEGLIIALIEKNNYLDKTVEYLEEVLTSIRNLMDSYD